MATIPMYIPIDGFLYIIIYLVLLPFFLNIKKKWMNYITYVYTIMNAFTHHIFNDIIDRSSPTKKMKNPPPRFICCKCRKQQPFSSNSRLRCMVLRENGKIISFSPGACLSCL